MSVPTISPSEMQLLLSRAGLLLNPGQVADLVLAWRQIAGLIASIPHERPLTDDMALSFKLPPPLTTAPGAKAPAPKAKAGPRAKAKAAPKRRPMPPRRKGARRSR